MNVTSRLFSHLYQGVGACPVVVVPGCRLVDSSVCRNLVIALDFDLTQVVYVRQEQTVMIQENVYGVPLANADEGGFNIFLLWSGPIVSTQTVDPDRILRATPNKCLPYFVSLCSPCRTSCPDGTKRA